MPTIAPTWPCSVSATRIIEGRRGLLARTRSTMIRGTSDERCLPSMEWVEGLGEARKLRSRLGHGIVGAASPAMTAPWLHHWVPEVQRRAH